MAIEYKILKTASLTTISKVISIFAGIITLPILLKSLGKDDYGLFILISSLTGYIGLMTFGATSTLKNKVIEAYNRSDFIQTNLIISSIFSIYFIVFLINLLSFLLITIFHPELYYNILNDYPVTSDTKYIFFILIFTSLINTFIGSIFVNCYHGINKLDFLAKLQAWITIISTFIYIFFLFSEPNLLAVTIFYLIQSFCIIVLNFFFLRKNYIHLHIYISKQSILYFSELKKSSYYFFIASLLTIVASSADYIMISKFMGTDEIAIFDLSQKIYLIIASAFPIAYSSWPIVSQFYFKNKKNALHALFYKTVRLNILTKATFFLPAFLLYPLIIKYWLGDEYVTDTNIYFSFLLIYWNNLFFGIFSLFFSATENQKHLVVLTLIYLLINIGSSLLIFFQFNLGLLSFLLGTLISQYVLFILYVIKYKKIFGKSLNIQYFLRYFTTFGFLVGILYFLMLLLNVYNDLTLQNCILIGTLIVSYFIVVYYLILNQSEQKTLQTFFIRKIRT